jgi:hypothetical protein
MARPAPALLRSGISRRSRPRNRARWQDLTRVVPRNRGDGEPVETVIAYGTYRMRGYCGPHLDVRPVVSSGTEGSNPAPSSGESNANRTSSYSSRQE